MNYRPINNLSLSSPTGGGAIAPIVAPLGYAIGNSLNKISNEMG